MESTVYHELVHYVQDQKGLLADTSCNSEFQAHLMVCYIKVYGNFAWGNMPGFNDADADKIINPFYEYFDAIKEGKSETWLLMEDTLNNAGWGKYTEKFQTYWKGK